MSDHEHDSGTHLLIAFLAGAAVGAAVALLTAPRSGRETREKLRGLAEDLGERAKRAPGAAREAYERAADAARRAFADAFDENDSGPA